MGLSWDDATPKRPKGPKRPKPPKKSSGGGTGTTVGMSIAIFGSAFLVAVTVFGYIVAGHLA